MYRRVLLVISVCCVLGKAESHSASKRDEPSLQTILQEQSKTIQVLSAKLTAQQSALTSLAERVTDLENDRQHLQARLDKQEQKVAFFVDFGLTPAQEVNIGMTSPVIFERTLLDIGGAFNNQTGVFTAPYSGLYSFSLHIIGGVGDHGDIEVGIFTQSGMQAVAAAEGSGTDTNDKDSCTALLHLQHGDQVYAQHSFGGTFLWGSQETSFYGVLLFSD